ncbi:MAG TPA: FtsK/SpoIIIE domain-containing protein, partial [Phycisphaerales bacterium]|nr:FtsK/SpoIIIE domain-containing protein [Phycisphaerales bacterium]
WSALQARWTDGLNTFQQGATEIISAIASTFPQFTDDAFEAWQPPQSFNSVIPFGEFSVDTTKLPGGLPRHESLIKPAPSAWQLPAMLTFPDAAHLFIETADQGRAESVALLQTVMFRLLTSLPPGKVHFTLIDPVGLGQNLAGFMHLADYDGRFVTDRIWTEDRHIDQRLLDLTEHMETVIQKYLRNEYATIAEYNHDAGEIAEPYRILVVTGFPVNFSENAARRLASIIASGPRCGVHALIAADTRLPLPQGIQLADLQSSSINLKFENGRMVWKDDEFQRYPLSIDAPPSEDLLTRVLHKVGALAKNTIRVEVPFGVVAPPETETWSQSTAEEVRVALGRAGATKLQYLSLGQGTRQHALVAGKTGSGKSTLLHALVTNLALWYSPAEVQFFLVDFKKGVEFKTYATHQLPHARVVAIESDREFGLSVLQRLDAELKRRGELYRDLNVQDVAGFRRAAPDQVLPRLLLIVDEFQELFTEDDKIAQDSALLLDRLVRQGRAFGMHVVLGSQTLGGAYSLARSTLGQMGVRIALQCSEADSYLILSDDNAAARLLSRPGEAIYNDASGLIEGNSPFQIVWLPETTRDTYLARVSRLADARHARPDGPPVIFEGNIPADLTRNPQLADMITRSDWPMPNATRSASAWLGDAIAIKPPTAANFSRQSGANLLLVGQRDESALALLASSLVSLASQQNPANARFYILDGSTADSPYAGELQRVASHLPHDVRNVAWRDVPAAMTELHTELADRQQSHETNPLSVYILIYSLQRYRMLRAADEFSFAPSDPDAPPPTEKQFADLLREGPPLGIHTLVWCDTPSNLTRALERQALRDFEQRVLFQMSAADSSNLIDSPAAARLGMHRAFFFSEEHGVLEKFRPYAFPTVEFLESLRAALKTRASAAQPRE